MAYICTRSNFNTKILLKMGEITISFIIGILILCLLIPLTFHYLRFWKLRKKRDTIDTLCDLLFPGDTDGLMRDMVVSKMRQMTNGRYDDEGLLDYYLKIKGLQMIDLNSFNDNEVRKFLMQPTKIRLKYDETVSFYEVFLNQSQARGINAEGGYDCNL